MNLDEYFRVDKNQLVLRGDTVCARFSRCIRKYNPLWENNREYTLKEYHWLDKLRHESKNLEKDFFDYFNVDYKLLPEECKDLNLSEQLVPFVYSNLIGYDMRYTKYLREQWHKLRSILLNDTTFVDNDDFTTTIPITGTVSEIPFLVAYAKTVEGFYNKRMYKMMEKSYLKYNPDSKFSLIESFNSSTCHNVKNNWTFCWDDSDPKIKTSTFAFYLEVLQSIKKLKTIKKVA